MAYMEFSLELGKRSVRLGNSPTSLATDNVAYQTSKTLR